jgi:hypothetical protein
MERKGKLTRKVTRTPVECKQTHGNLKYFGNHRCLSRSLLIEKVIDDCHFSGEFSLSFHSLRYNENLYLCVHSLNCNLERRKNKRQKLNKRERSIAYLTHVCRQPWSLECLEKIENRSFQPAL